MSNSRDLILRAVRDALGREPLTTAQAETLGARQPAHTRPAVEDALTAHFVRKFESHAGTVSHVASLADVPQAVEAYCTAQGLARKAAVGGALHALDWPADWHIHHDPAGIDEGLSVTPCLAGIAETGSLMLGSGPGSPTTHNFVPDDHVVVLHTTQIVRHLEDAWPIVRAHPEGIPRTINFISGPSRTADVELTIQLGAHGPRRMHVILVDNQTSAAQAPS